MKTSINILILGVGRSKDAKRCVLDYAIVDLKESQNRKGYNVCQTWSDSDSMFNKIKNSDIGKVFKADINFIVSNNGQPKMVIENVYN